MRRVAPSVLLALAVTGFACRGQQQTQQGAQPVTDPMVQQLRSMAARFAPVELTADISSLPTNERQALARLVEAAKIFDSLFLRQVWSGNESMLLALAQDSSELGRARLHYFLVNKGPWSRLDHNEPFIPGAPPKPPQGSFYPPGSTKAAVESWIKTLPPAERTRATGFFTTIRSGPDGRLTAVPYSIEYQAELGRVAALLREGVRRLQPVARQRDLRLLVENSDLPSIPGDAAQLDRVFGNLLENAAKYTPAGGTITLKSSASAEKVVVSVHNTGAVIPAEDLPRIFDRFYRVDKSRARDVEGSGLGLAIAREVVERHGGSIAVDSTEERGTTFTVTLSLAPSIPYSDAAKRVKSSEIADGWAKVAVGPRGAGAGSH